MSLNKVGAWVRAVIKVGSAILGHIVVGFGVRYDLRFWFSIRFMKDIYKNGPHEIAGRYDPRATKL